MLFNSLEFALFLPIVFVLYWYVLKSRLKLQNILILAASYVFYGWWDWRFLSLIVFSSFIDFFIGLKLEKQESKPRRKMLLLISIFVNIGFLGFFKYFNFFIDSFVDAFTFFGYNMDPRRLNIILPVGISFYTFQTLSYTIDVYRRKLEPTRNFTAFFAFVSFFPQLVAGPIERATNLLPQFYKKRIFDFPKAVDGLRQILWGLFKKIVIADNCAIFVNDIFSNYTDYSGITLFWGSLFFAFQIYCDFSGYSDIAIGTSRLFGFNLMRNFAFPYFSRDIAEFWRRWHISLSTWFRDYVYIPLGGSRVSNLKIIRNTFVIFIVSGFWHGANWTFIVWGALNAIYFLPLLLMKRNRKYLDDIEKNKILPSIREFIQIASTFFITLIAWIFFRAENLYQAFDYVGRIFTNTFYGEIKKFPLEIVLTLVVFVLIEWVQRDKQHALQLNNNRIPRILRWTLYYSIIAAVIWLGAKQQEFIYFQF